MKKLALTLFAAFALAFSANAYVEYPADPASCENLFLELKADTLYFYHDCYDGPYYSFYRDDPAFRKGQRFEWADGSQAKCFREFIEKEGREHGVIYDNIIIFADYLSTASFAVELQNALSGLIGLNSVVFVIPPKYWHGTPVSLAFYNCGEPMPMEAFLADPGEETLGATFTMYEDGQGISKQRPNSDIYYNQYNLHELLSSLDTGENYPYLNIKVPQNVTLSNFVASVDEVGQAKQANPVRMDETYFVPDSSQEFAAAFYIDFVDPALFVPTIDKEKSLFPKDCEELGLQSLPVFCFSQRGEDYECRPGSFYFTRNEKIEPYTFWAGSPSNPKAERGSYVVDFTVCADGSLKDIQPNADWVKYHKDEDWNYVKEKLYEEPTWRPALDVDGKPVNVRLYSVRLFLTF